MNNVVLIGDSIFDNAHYVAEGECVSAQLQALLPADSRVTLLAIDGSVTAQAEAQLERFPRDATHLFVSSGGNDALRAEFRIFDPLTGLEAVDVLNELTVVLESFLGDYRALMTALQPLGLPTAVCTVYDAIPVLKDTQRTALRCFNDVIVGEAARAGFPVIDLRAVCADVSDYSSISPIEPSAAGGQKIANAIVRLMSEHDFDLPRTMIYI